MDTLDIKVEQNIESVEDFQFEPIKGQPMLNWRGKRPFTSTQFYPEMQVCGFLRINSILDYQ